jgi:hypothetical protein
LKSVFCPIVTFCAGQEGDPDAGQALMKNMFRVEVEPLHVECWLRLIAPLVTTPRFFPRVTVERLEAVYVQLVESI